MPLQRAAHADGGRALAKRQAHGAIRSSGVSRCGGESSVIEAHGFRARHHRVHVGDADCSVVGVKRQLFELGSGQSAIALQKRKQAIARVAVDRDAGGGQGVVGETRQITSGIGVTGRRRAAARRFERFAGFGARAEVARLDDQFRHRFECAGVDVVDHLRQGGSRRVAVDP